MTGSRTVRVDGEDFENDAPIRTPPAPAHDGSIWLATDEHLYVAR